MKLPKSNTPSYPAPKRIAMDFSYNLHFQGSIAETYICDVWLMAYPSGQNCLVLRDSLYGEPVAQCTTNLNMSDKTEAMLCTNYVAIKDYAENEGMLSQLVNAGIVSQPVLLVGGIYANVSVCELLAMAASGKES